jgi:hypothetical protein
MRMARAQQGLVEAESDSVHQMVHPGEVQVRRGSQPEEAGDVPLFRIPRLRVMARHAAPNVVVGTLAPTALFLLGLRLLGVWGAIVLGVVWVYGVIAVRLLRRGRVPGLLLLGAVTITARTVIALATGSVFLYLLQPSLGTALVAVAFLASVPAGRPLAERLAHDFVPIPPDILADGRVKRFFVRVTLLWGCAHLLNAAVSVWLLLSQSIGVVVMARTATSLLVTGSAILVSTLWFRRVIASAPHTAAVRVSR